jgi:hypothetical protein
MPQSQIPWLALHCGARSPRWHVRDGLIAYNFAKRPKALRFKAPYEAIEEPWKAKPDISGYLSSNLTIIRRD